MGAMRSSSCRASSSKQGSSSSTCRCVSVLLLAAVFIGVILMGYCSEVVTTVAAPYLDELLPSRLQHPGRAYNGRTVTLIRTPSAPPALDWKSLEPFQAGCSTRSPEQAADLVCIMNSQNSFMVKHIAHAAHSLYPCWSLFRAHSSGASANAGRSRIILLRDGLAMDDKGWFGGLLTAMGAKIAYSEAELCGTGAALTAYIEEGHWLGNSTDGAALRDAVLSTAPQTRGLIHQVSLSGTTGTATNSSRPLKVLLLNRSIRDGRHLVQHAAIADAIRTFHTSSTVNPKTTETATSTAVQAQQQLSVVVAEETMDGKSLHEQAELISSYDIILSPHGNQLTNMVFGQRCAVLLEIFPPDYLKRMFQPLAADAGMLAFHMYAPLPGEEGRLWPDEPNEGRRIRKAQLYYTPQDIMAQWPALLNARRECIQARDDEQHSG